MSLPALAMWDPEDCPRLSSHDTTPAVRNAKLPGWMPWAAERQREADEKRDAEAKRRGGARRWQGPG